MYVGSYRHIIRSIATVCCVIGLMLTLSGQAELQKDTSRATQKVHIDKAKTLTGSVIDTSDYMFLVGDVELSQDSLFIYCDSAVVVDEQEVRAYGNVIIQKGDSLTIFSDTLYYHSDTMRARVSGDVVLENDKERMFTPSLEYDLNRDIAYFYSGALLVNDSTQITSRSGYYLTRTSQARLIDSVVVVSPQVTLLADSLDYNTKLQLAEFVGPTLIVQQDASIYCEDGFYDVRREQAEFIRNATYTSVKQQASADTIRYLGYTSLVNLIGDAKFIEDDRQIDSEEIQYYEETGETYIIGSAVLKDSLRYVESDRIEFNRVSEKLKTLGRSTLEENGQELTADLINFDQTTGIGTATGQVIYYDTTAKTVILCDSAYFERATEYVKATGPTRPMLKSVVDADTMYLTADTLVFQRQIDSILVIDSVSADTLEGIQIEKMLDDSTTIVVDSIRYDSAFSYTVDTAQVFSAFADVRLFKGTLQGMCDSMEFNSLDSIFHLMGDPVMWSDTTQFNADSIDILLTDGSIDKVFLRQRAIVVSEVQGQFYNQIKGRYMVARMVNDELEDLSVTGNAESVYYAMDESGAFVGVNQVVAGKIFFTFDQKQLSGIRFYSQPDGEMKPMGEVNHGTLRLEGFSWQNDLRPKTLDDLF